MSRIAVIDGIRTPFVKYQTDFRSLSAQELGRIACRELIERTGLDPALLDEVIIGCVAQPAEAANLARVVALLAGVPERVPAFTVHRNCASGIEAAVQAVLKIRQDEGALYLTGGTESMSNIPLYYSAKTQQIFAELARAKTLPARLRAFAKFRMGELLKPTVGLMQGLTDPVCGLNMGQTAEVLAKEFGITRQEQDDFALLSAALAISKEDAPSRRVIVCARKLFRSFRGRSTARPWRTITDRVSSRRSRPWQNCVPSLTGTPDPSRQAMRVRLRTAHAAC